MINLHNITVSPYVEGSRNGFTAYMKTSINGFTPLVCIKPIYMGDKRSGSALSLYYLSSLFSGVVKNKKPLLEKFSFVDYFSALTITALKKEATKSSYSYHLSISSKEDIKKWNTSTKKIINDHFVEYVNDKSPILNNLSFSTNSYNYDYLSCIFNSILVDRDGLLPIMNTPIIGKDITNCYIVVSRGFCGIYNPNTVEIVPLIMLMIKDDYISYYKGANLLEMPIDYSKFEFWVHDKIEEIEGGNKVITYLLDGKTGINSSIPFVVKTNLTENFSKFKFPKLDSISERMEWLTSTKNDFLNSFHKLSEPLPVKKFEVQTPSVSTISVKFRSRKLNKIISTAAVVTDIKSADVAKLPKNIPKDKFTLIA